VGILLFQQGAGTIIITVAVVLGRLPEGRINKEKSLRMLK
jgi:hypothetical protein